MTPAPPAGSLKGEYAGVVTRLLALLTDIVVLSAAVVVTNTASQLLLDSLLGRFSLSASIADFLQQGRTAVLILLALWLPPLYEVFFLTLIGQTPGKMLLGVRVVRLNGARVTLKHAIIRYLGYFVSAFLLLGFAWALVDNRRQTWHDKLARTVVIYVWDGEQGQAFRRLRQARTRVRPPGGDLRPTP